MHGRYKWKYKSLGFLSLVPILLLVHPDVLYAQWGGWEDLGGVIKEQPECVSWGSNRIDCFARGGGDHMYHKWWNGSKWGGWENLSGVIKEQPECVSWGSKRIDCFARGGKNHMYHKWWPGQIARCSPPAQQHLAVTLRPQETSMWCWAASGQMTMEFLGSNIAQCLQANNRFGRNDCCQTPTPAGCVQGGWPEYAKYDFTSKHTNNTALSWNELRKELSDTNSCGRRAFAFSWHWPGGGGHMMAAIGYKTVDNVNYVEVNDPWAPNVGDHRFDTYDYYVESAGHHTHWDDYYEIKPTEGN
jgi:hypothetical protein